MNDLENSERKIEHSKIKQDKQNEAEDVIHFLEEERLSDQPVEYSEDYRIPDVRVDEGKVEY